MRCAVLLWLQEQAWLDLEEATWSMDVSSGRQLGEQPMSSIRRLVLVRAVSDGILPARGSQCLTLFCSPAGGRFLPRSWEVHGLPLDKSSSDIPPPQPRPNQ